MENNRRKFLKGTFLAGVLLALPGPVKKLASRFIPASEVVRWKGLSHSTPALRATWPAVAAVTARVVAARGWLVGVGVTASVALKAYMNRHKFLPTWYNPMFRPSLRNIRAPHTVR